MARLLFPPPPRGAASVGLLLLRLIAGAAIFLHGLQKMQNPAGWMGPGAPVPGYLQVLAAGAECVGGLAWIVGLLTPIASLGIATVMVVAVGLVHLPSGDPFVRVHGGPAAGPAPLAGLPALLVRQGGEGGSMELAGLYLAVAVLLLCVGPGALSLDAALFSPRRYLATSARAA